jgi:hypothetical protein
MYFTVSFWKQFLSEFYERPFENIERPLQFSSKTLLCSSSVIVWAKSSKTDLYNPHPPWTWKV